jgi:hypothetical protein
MPKIVITQKNFDGAGGDRVHSMWVARGQAEITVRRKSQAYNMDHTTIEVMED